jgi:hypothetical protein
MKLSIPAIAILAGCPSRISTRRSFAFIVVAICFLLNFHCETYLGRGNLHNSNWQTIRKEPNIRRRLKNLSLWMKVHDIPRRSSEEQEEHDKLMISN